MIDEQQNDAFAEFMAEGKPIRLGLVDPNQPRTAWLLTLEGRWQMCMCEAGDDRTWILKGAAALHERIDDVRGGVSGDWREWHVNARNEAPLAFTLDRA